MKTSRRFATLATASALTLAPAAQAVVTTLTARGIRVSDNKVADFVVQFDPAQTITQNTAPGFALYGSTSPNAIGTFTIAGQPSVSFGPGNFSVGIYDNEQGTRDRIIFDFNNTRFRFSVDADAVSFSGTGINNIFSINSLIASSDQPVSGFIRDNSLPQINRDFSIGTDFPGTSWQLISIPAPSSLALGAGIVGFAAIRRRRPAATSVELA